MPEIISSIRQAGKIARQEEFQNNLSDVEDPFAKKFEVLFCGRVTVAHKNAPPALIDECIEKFNRASCTKKSDFNSSSQQHETANNFGGFSFSSKFRSVFQPLVSEEEEKGQLGNLFLSLDFVPLLLRRISKREALGVTALSGLSKKMQFH